MRARPVLVGLIGCSGVACAAPPPSGASPATQLDAVVEAARTGGPEAKIVLQDALDSDDPAVKLMATTALGRSERD